LSSKTHFSARSLI